MEDFDGNQRFAKYKNMKVDDEKVHVNTTPRSSQQTFLTRNRHGFPITLGVTILSTLVQTVQKAVEILIECKEQERL